jgi:hypothetical protein
MANETEGLKLHSLIPLEDFKAILGMDDRENALSRYCLITATYSIEQFCKRRLLVKKHTDYLTFTGEHIFTLKEYPVRKVLCVNAKNAENPPPCGFSASSFCGAKTSEFGYSRHPWRQESGKGISEETSLVDPKHYYCLEEEGGTEDLPGTLMLRPLWRLSREEGAIRVRYIAGYAPGKVPADLASACLELAAWNMSRYRGRRIGITGNIRGKGQDGEHLEASMPENVRLLLEPYKRAMI